MPHFRAVDADSGELQRRKNQIDVIDASGR